VLLSVVDFDTALSSHNSRHVQYCFYLLVSLFLAVFLSLGHATERPNIIVLLADDLGYGDVACYGGKAVPTPALDALAAGGKKFTSYCCAAAVCTPTRASLLTGRQPWRFGIQHHFPDGPEHLPRGVFTLPQLLKEAGYTTAHVGKWHLGGLRQVDVAARKANDSRANPGPREHGFDHYLAMYESPEPRGSMVRQATLYQTGASHMLRDDQPVDLMPRHLTDVETDEAARLLENFATAKRPFYLQLWFDTPHKPYEPAPEEIMAKLPAGSTGHDRLYAGMLAHLDASVARLISKLEVLGLRENTIVLFSSDNGPTGAGSAGPWRGGKGTLFEAGFRVPFIANWPGHISPSQTDALAYSTDVLPTVCAAAGVSIPTGLKLDGLDLMPHLLGGAAPERSSFFWKLKPYANFQKERHESPPYATEAVRDGRWKLLTNDATPIALYDTIADPTEQSNVLDKQPEQAARLTSALKSWLAEPRPSN
jgi:arylsulfatase A